MGNQIPTNDPAELAVPGKRAFPPPGGGGAGDVASAETVRPKEDFSYLPDQIDAPKPEAPPQQMVKNQQDVTDDLPDKPTPLQSTYAQVKGVDPEKAAQVTKFASMIGEPTDFVERNFEVSRSAANELNPGALKRVEDNAPSTSAWLADPQNAASTHDDILNLAHHEINLKALSNTWDATQAAFHIGALENEAALIRNQQFEGQDVDTSSNFRFGPDIASSYGITTTDHTERINQINAQVAQLRAQYEPEKTGDSVANTQWGTTIAGRAANLLNIPYPGWIGKSARDQGYKGTLFNFVKFQPMLADSGMEGMKYGIPAGLATGVFGPEAIPAGITLGVSTGVTNYNYKLFQGQALMQLDQIEAQSGQKFSPEVKSGASIIMAAAQAGMELSQVQKLLGVTEGGKAIFGALSDSVGKQVLDSPATRSALYSNFIKNWLGQAAHFTGTMMGLTATGKLGEESAKAVTEWEGQQIFPEPNATQVGPLTVNTGTAKDIFSSGTEGAKMGVLMGFLSAGAQGYHERAQVLRTEATQEALKNAKVLHDESKLRERNQEQYGEFLDHITKDTEQESVHINAQAFNEYFQSKNIDPKKAAEELGVTESHKEGTATHGDIQIPFSTYVSKLAGGPHYEGLSPDVKFHPEDLSPNELKEREKTLKEEADKVPAEPTSNDILHQEISSQLQDAGHPREIADHQALQLERHYNARAQILGIDPLELWKKDNTSIQSGMNDELVGENRLEQGKDVRDELQTKFPIPEKTESIELSPNESFKGLEPSELRSLSKDRAQHAIERKGVINANTGWKVNVTGEGLKKSAQFASRIEQSVALENVPELIENASYIRSDSDRDGSSKKYDYLYSPFHIGDKQYVAKITVENSGRREKKFYALHAMEVESPSDTPNINPEGGHNSRPDGRTVTKDQLLDFVNQGRNVSKLFQSKLPATITPTNQSPLGFYSPVEKAVSAMDFKEMPAKDLMNRIKNLPGIKGEELEWMGLPDFLAAKEGKVSKAEVVKFIQDNGLKIEQKVLSSDFKSPKGGSDSEDTPHASELEWDTEGRHVGNMYDDDTSSEYDYHNTDNDYYQPGGEWEKEWRAENESSHKREDGTIDEEALKKEMRHDRESAISDEITAMLESPYSSGAKFRYTEAKTDWTIEGADDYGWWVSDQNGRNGFHVDGSIEEAKVQAAQKMMESGYVDGDQHELIRKEDIEWRQPHNPAIPTHKTLEAKAKKLLKANPAKFETLARENNRWRYDTTDANNTPEKMAEYLKEDSLEQAVATVSDSYLDTSNKKNEVHFRIKHPLLNGSLLGNDVKGYVLHVSGEDAAYPLQAKSVDAAKLEAIKVLQDNKHIAGEPGVKTPEEEAKLDPNAPTGRSKFNSYKIPGGENYREVLIRLPKLKDGTFTDGHFSESNVLAHVRLTDRTSPWSADDIVKAKGNESGTNGLPAQSKVLTDAIESKSFASKGLSGLETKDREAVLASVVGAVSDSQIRDSIISLVPVEVMNDLVRAKLTPKEFFHNEAMLSDSLAGNPDAVVKLGDSAVSALVRTVADLTTKRISDSSKLPMESIDLNSAPSASNLHREKRILFIEELQSDLHQKGREEGYKSEGGDIPNAPFKNTDAWAALAMKRIIRMAVEQGYDSVAWSPAEVQIDRWGTDNLSWKKVYDDKRYIIVANGSFDRSWDYGVADTNIKDAQKGVVAKFKTREEAKAEMDNLGASAHFLVGSAEQRGGNVDGMNIEELARRRGELLERNGDKVTTKEELREVVKSTLGRQRNEEALNNLTESLWKQMQENPEGSKSPRAEGMQFFYDNLLPKKVVPGILKKLDPEAKVGAGNIELPKLRDDYKDAKEGSPYAQQQVWQIPITDKMKEEAMKGQALFQKGGDGEARGSLQYNDTQRIINLGKTADLSTFLHESGHVFLLNMAKDYETISRLKDSAMSETTPEQRQFLDDAKTILDKFGIKDFSELTTEHHEKFADTVENYFRTGKAPSEALKSAFARFRSWLVSIYQQAKANGLKLTPEITGVMDRLVATREEIEHVQKSQSMDPLFPDPKAVGMSDAQAARYSKAVQTAKDSAESELANRLMKSMNREQSEEYQKARERVRDQVSKQVDQQKDQIALALLQRGTQPDGSPLPENQTGGFSESNKSAIKLSKKDIVSQFGEERLKELPKPYVYSREGGIHPDIAADMLGFKSGDELLQALVNAEKRDVVIDRMTDQQMALTHGDLKTDPGKLAEQAMEIVHSDQQAQLMKKELDHLVSDDFPAAKAMIKKLARDVPTVQQVREAAEKQIAAKRVRDISPVVYQRAESKAGKEAMDAFLRGDFKEAFDKKRAQLLAHEMYKAAIDARDDIQKIVKYVSSFEDAKAQQRLGRAGEEYLNPINGILDRYDFRKSISGSELDERASLLKFVQDQKAKGFDVDIPKKLIEDASKRHYKDASYEELQGVSDTVEMIDTISRLKNELLANKKFKSFQEAKAYALSSIEAHHDTSPDDVVRAPGAKARAKKWIAQGDAAHTRMEFLFDRLDGHKPHGPVWETFFKPFADAEDSKAVLQNKSNASLKEIFSAYPKNERALWFYNKTHIPEINDSLTKANMLVVALNQGNEYNKQALLDGEKWNQGQVEAILKHLDKRDWQTVQKIWDHINTLWPQAEALEKRLNGVAPEKVKASKVVTPHGVFEGGYYPIVFNGERSFKQLQIDEKADINDLMGGNWARAMTAHGHLKERTDTGGKPLSLELSGLTNHLMSTIHDITHREAVIDAHKMINDREMRDAITNAVGPEMYKELNPWLKHIAGDRGKDPNNWVESLWRAPRSGATIVNLGLNVTSGLAHATGYSVVVKEIGAEYAYRGMKDTFSSIAQFQKAIEFSSSMSHFMEERNTVGYERDVRDVAKRLNIAGVDNGAMSVVHAYTGDVQRSFLHFITLMDKFTSVPAWMGAYQKAMEGGLEHVDAGDQKASAEYADSVVRMTKIASGAKDLPRVQRGTELQKLFTMFYGPSSVRYNQMRQVQTEYQMSHDVPQVLASAALVWFIPAVLDSMIRGRMPGTDDEPEKWLKWFGKQSAMYPLESVIGLRDIVRGADSKSYEASPAFGAMDSLSQSIKHVAGIATGEKGVSDLSRKDVKDMALTAGYFSAMPTRAVWKSVEYFHDWLTGEETPSNPIEGLYHGLVSGKPHKGNK